MHILALSRMRDPQSVLIFGGPVSSAAAGRSSLEPAAPLPTAAPATAVVGVTSLDGGTDLEQGQQVY